jgi:GDP-4-dehydro-6-deoxy-D-mannose reductase
LLSFAKNNSTKNELVSGNTAIIRDFVDVRDVVNAYYLLFKKGKKGELYNICTGKGTSLYDVIQIMANELKISVSNKINTDLVRPNDNEIIIGSNEKIKNDTGWKPTFPIEESLKEVLNYFQTL